MKFYTPHLEEYTSYRQHYRQCLHLNSESSFLALWAYTGNSQIERAYEHGMYWNKGVIAGKMSLLPPIGEWERDDWSDLLTQAFPEGTVFSFVPEILLKKWQRALGDKIVFVEERDSWDYICGIQEFLCLEGSSFKSIRRSIEKFTKTYAYDYVRITPEMLPKIEAFQTWWYEENVRLGKADHEMLLEHESMLATFRDWNKLSDVFGACLIIDGTIQAYTVAEELDTYMVSSNALKGNYAYKGIYQAMDYLFTKDRLSDYTFINLWDDGGYEGLRKTKMALNPMRFIKKFTVTWKP